MGAFGSWSSEVPGYQPYTWRLDLTVPPELTKESGGLSLTFKISNALAITETSTCPALDPKFALV